MAECSTCSVDLKCVVYPVVPQLFRTTPEAAASLARVCVLFRNCYAAEKGTLRLVEDEEDSELLNGNPFRDMRYSRFELCMGPQTLVLRIGRHVLQPRPVLRDDGSGLATLEGIVGTESHVRLARRSSPYARMGESDTLVVEENLLNSSACARHLEHRYAIGPEPVRRLVVNGLPRRGDWHSVGVLLRDKNCVKCFAFEPLADALFHNLACANDTREEILNHTPDSLRGLLLGLDNIDILEWRCAVVNNSPDMEGVGGRLVQTEMAKLYERLCRSTKHIVTWCGGFNSINLQRLCKVRHVEIVADANVYNALHTSSRGRMNGIDRDVDAALRRLENLECLTIHTVYTGIQASLDHRISRHGPLRLHVKEVAIYGKKCLRKLECMRATLAVLAVGVVFASRKMFNRVGAELTRMDIQFEYVELETR